jgi:hypothetical protein
MYSPVKHVSLRAQASSNATRGAHAIMLVVLPECLLRDDATVFVTFTFLTIFKIDAC